MSASGGQIFSVVKKNTANLDTSYESHSLYFYCQRNILDLRNKINFSFIKLISTWVIIEQKKDDQTIMQLKSKP